MAKFFLEIARNMIDNSVKKGVFLNPAFQLAEEKFNPIKQSVVEEFNNHIITKEIEAGILSDNISQTLQGLGHGRHREKDQASPNLSSFIGFENGSNPTEPIRDLLTNQIYLKKVARGARYEKSKDNIRYEFPVYYPGASELDNAAPMPWSTAKSWIAGIEKGISNLNEYLYWRLGVGRSGAGLQADRPLRQGSIFKPIKYLSEILANFKKRIS